MTYRLVDINAYYYKTQASPNEFFNNSTLKGVKQFT